MRSVSFFVIGCACAVSACGRSPDSRATDTAAVAAPEVARDGGSLSVVAPQPESLSRVITRQIVSRAVATDGDVSGRVVADLAREIPTDVNGGVTAGGSTYTFHLRPGITLNATPRRSLTAHDVARELSTVPRSSAAGRYLSETMVGVTAPDDSTIVFRLRHAANDFLDILAMPGVFAVACGPYQVAQRTPNGLTLIRSLAWDGATDRIRSSHVDSILVSFADHSTSALDVVRSGGADATAGFPLPPAAVSALVAARDSALVMSPGYTSVVRLVMNVVSPNNGGVIRRRDVRRALAFAVDRAAIVQLRGGASVARAAQQLVPPGWAGAIDGFAPFATLGDRANAARAQEMLLAAGVRDTLRLRLVVPPGDEWMTLATMLRTQLIAAGVHVDVDQRANAPGLLGSPAATRAGEWDMALGVVMPDWYGESNGRTVLLPSFHSPRDGVASANVGLYGNPAIDEVMEHALGFRTPAETRDAWQTAAGAILEDAAWIPLVYERTPIFRSSRVRNCVLDPGTSGCDLAAIWIAR